MMMTYSVDARQDEELHYQQAAEWFLLLRDGNTTDAQIAAWLEWTRADSRNAAAFERVSAVANGLAELDPSSKAALAARYAATTRMAPASNKSLHRLAYAALAAGLVGIAVLLAGYYAIGITGAKPATGSTYAVGKAETRDVTLADGTQITMGAATRLEVDYTARERAVKLLEGEAYFQVVHNAQRPFVVNAGVVHLTDVGTEFDVRKTGNYVSVAVSKGAVAVDLASQGRGVVAGVPLAELQPLVLTAGHDISADGIALNDVRTATVNRDDVASWRKGWLRFTDTPLPVVVANVNRYSKREIVITDPRVYQMHYTGTVYLNRIDDWLTAVQRTFDLRATLVGSDQQMLLYMRDSRKPAASD